MISGARAFALGPLAAHREHRGLTIGRGDVLLAGFEARRCLNVVRAPADEAHDFLVEEVDFAADFVE